MVASWDSIPRSSLRRGTHIIPALLISKCKGLPEAIKFSAKASIDVGDIKSIATISTFLIPSRFFFAFSISRAGMITVAPAAARTFVVSNPIPVLPPVTIAIFPVRSMF
ncbi:hypothetical protein D3C86_1366290 [compost metagenome]